MRPVTVQMQPHSSAQAKTSLSCLKQADGVQAGIDYVCHVTMTVTAYNGTNIPGDKGGKGSIETQTSPKSEKTSITTLEGRGENFS